jgi:hypothetical protein
MLSFTLVVLVLLQEGETVAASSASLRRGIVAALSAHLLEIAATSAFQHYYCSHPPRQGQSETFTESL